MSIVAQTCVTVDCSGCITDVETASLEVNLAAFPVYPLPKATRYPHNHFSNRT